LIGAKDFEGQMSRAEYDRILQQMHSVNGSNARKGGRTTYRNGKGIYAMTEQEKETARRKGGQTSTGGIESHRKGVGIHALTQKQRSDAGIEGIIAQGHVPWDEQEKEHAYALAMDPGFRRDNNPSWARITEVLNSLYNNSRSWRAVMNSTRRYAKREGLDL
jgi:hypothetical protein